MRKTIRAMRRVVMGLGLAAVLAGAAGWWWRARRPAPSPPAPPADAGALDRAAIDLERAPFRKVAGFARVERERRPGLEVRVLLLGDQVHACSFDERLASMSCAVIDHKTQYGPHGEPSVRFADTEVGAPGWVVVPRPASKKAELLPSQFFELDPTRRVVEHLLWVAPFVGADGRVAVIQSHLDEDVLVHGRSDAPLMRAKLPAASGATQLAGQWLLWPKNDDELLVTRATQSGLEPAQTLAGKYRGEACHDRRGTWLLGERGGKTVVFVESDGRWSALEDATPRLRPRPAADRSFAGEELTRLTCTDRGLVIISQNAHRLDPRKPGGIEACAGAGECRYSLGLGVVRCSRERCVPEPQRSIDLGDGGLFMPPKVVPVGERLLVLWMTVQDVVKMKWIGPNGSTRARTLVGPSRAQLGGAWSRGDVAVLLLSERARGVRAIRIGPGDDDLRPVEQR